MKKILTLTLLLICNHSWGFDHNVVIGQWAVYQGNITEKDYYYFLNINSDYSGTLIRSLGREPITYHFTKKDVIKNDGYLVIKLNKHQKAIISAWKLESGSGKLTGQIFMYNENGDLFNMLYFPLELLETDHKYLQNDTIKLLSKKYR